MSHHTIDIEGDSGLGAALAIGCILIGILGAGLFATGLSVARICQGLACWYHYLMALVALVVVVCVMAAMIARR